MIITIIGNPLSHVLANTQPLEEYIRFNIRNISLVIYARVAMAATFDSPLRQLSELLNSQAWASVVLLMAAWSQL